MEKIIKDFMQDNFQCDACGGENEEIRVKSVEMFGCELLVHMSCNECDAEWTEVFNLHEGYVGYEDEDGVFHYEDEEEYEDDDEEEEEEE
jgi:hypothetical protein